MLIVRENTKENTSVGGRMYKDTEREIAIQETIMSSRALIEFKNMHLN